MEWGDFTNFLAIFQFLQIITGCLTELLESNYYFF